MHRARVVSAPVLLGIIAREFLGSKPGSVRLGDWVTLYPHQLDALKRINASIEKYGGALLCDDVGLGKTYVAIALIQQYRKAVVVAPAVLREMWTEAYEKTKGDSTQEMRFVSIESLSHDLPGDTYHDCDLVIIDEAHHARNSKTKRYRNLSLLSSGADILLMSATPIHNKREDMNALLALFLGEYAYSLEEWETSELLIRRDHTLVPLKQQGSSIPKRLPTRWIPAPQNELLFQSILDLPPPLPPRGSEETLHLATLSLVRQWVSSEGALKLAIQRRIARSTGILDSLNVGRYPTAGEIRAWLFSEDAIQLALPTIVTANSAAHTPERIEELKTTVLRYKKALYKVLSLFSTDSGNDLQKSYLLRKIRKRHRGERIIAFSQYTGTVTSLFNHLKTDPHVAALTSRGGMIASGTVNRPHILKRFAPRGTTLRTGTSPSAAHLLMSSNVAKPDAQPDFLPSPGEDITFLLATDLLSEGINLQDASVVIHLDLPWTVATLDQRVGRCARLGSPYQEIAIYGFSPPRCATKILRTTEILRRKAQVTYENLQTTPVVLEKIRERLKSWQGLAERMHFEGRCHNLDNCFRTGKVTVARTSPTGDTAFAGGFLALLLINDMPTLLASDRELHATTDPQRIMEVMDSIEVSWIGNVSEPIDMRDYRQAMSAIDIWSQNLEAAKDAGLIHLPISSRRSSQIRRTELRRIEKELGATPWFRRARQAELSRSARMAAAFPPMPGFAFSGFTFNLAALLLINPHPLQIKE